MEPGEALPLAEARAMIRAGRLRCTSCRIAVLQHVFTAAAPVSHAEVAQQLVPRGFDKSTIYRSLVEMADAGVLNRLELGDHVWRFEMAGESRGDPDHPHFMCLDCGKVTCLPDFQVQVSTAGQSPAAEFGQVTEVLLKGHCAQCQ